MNKRFFSIRIPFFGTVAMLILCVVCFMLPFALRGARMAFGEVKNNVADWLPSNFPETIDLEEFRKHFVGDQFVMLTGPWCREGGENSTYSRLLKKIRAESLEDYEGPPMSQEEERAHRKGDELGLMPAVNYHEEWGEHNERWLQGHGGQWYWINHDGELYRWDGQNNVVEGTKRFIERSRHGKNKADGKLIDKFGPPASDEPNPFYTNPEKLCARPFKSVSTGPDILEMMAGPGGTIRIGKSDSEYDDINLAAFEARIEAHKRLTGSLFGPTPASDFNWTFESLLQQIDDSTLLGKLQSKTSDARTNFDQFIANELETRYNNDFEALTSSSQDEKLEMWYRMWYAIDSTMDPPARQTCFIVTLNEPIIDELARAIGRPILGKQRGRLLELATGICGIEAENVHIGGPPADNVAIDEEGTSTLVRLVSLSLLIGIGLSYASFRSVRVTIMLFFVGGVAAIASLSYVWYAGSTMDAILMTMPSLIYVLGLSGAVHIVNYYRDACYEEGPEFAVETAVRHGWFPCTLAAFTTALGLISLCTSSLTPINKFGFFSAIATMSTVILLFTYLPSALTIWPAGYSKRDPDDLQVDRGITGMVNSFWASVCEFVLRNCTAVAIVGALLMCFFCYGVTQIKTSVHLLKLFDTDAKILQDYRWIEEHVGKLVPAEILVTFDKESQREFCVAEERDAARKVAEEAGKVFDEAGLKLDAQKYDLKYNLLERIELSGRIRKQLEQFFGPEGLDIVGAGMSTDVFIPLQYIDTQVSTTRIDDKRLLFNGQLNSSYEEIRSEQYLARIEPGAEGYKPQEYGREMWRVSIRLAALNDVDYGEFINDLKTVVEPVLTAYRYRTIILNELHRIENDKRTARNRVSEDEDTTDRRNDEMRVLVLGRDPDQQKPEVASRTSDDQSFSNSVDQTYVFSDTLQDLIENRGFVRANTAVGHKKKYEWIDPTLFGEKNPFPAPEKWATYLDWFDCVVFVEDDPQFDVEFIKSNSRKFVDCRDHRFLIGPHGPAAGMLTAKQIQESTGNSEVTAIYTGIVPIVYKAQNQLLISLIESIGLAFLMISVVMMLLLRDWKTKLSFSNALNFRGGIISMLPNLFPILLVFGTMGLLKRKVDIGSMMTASVAMGVAVDDTIHFLNWYRQGLESGLKRIEAIRNAYRRVATAMTQTTLIGGLGLSAFALSTFTPTQRFGVLMLFLLAAALIGDLIFLPALLASPLGKLFGKEREQADETEKETAPVGESDMAELRVVSDENQRSDTDLHPDSLKHLEQDEGQADIDDRRQKNRRTNDRRG